MDEIIFSTSNLLNRMMLELMARSGMRVGEYLRLTPLNIDDRKAIIRDPKSGRVAKAVFLSQKVTDRLRKYIRERGIAPGVRIFPLTYAVARLSKKASNLVGIHVKSYDLCRHAATYTSRSGAPLEIGVKVTATPFEAINHTKVPMQNH